MFWAIECDNQWFCMKNNCWHPTLEKDCVFDSHANAKFFFDRWLPKDIQIKAEIITFELKRVENAKK